MADVISQNREEHSADRRYAKAEHTARMTSWGLWDTTRRRREKAGEKASRMEPNISEGLVIAEGGLLLLRKALFWTIVYSILQEGRWE